MSEKNPEYDFKWCPGCGDFGVRRALEACLKQYAIDTEKPMHNTVVVAGIGCSGNMVHLIEGEQPFGIHGIHGRTLPIAMGIKMSRPDLNVIVVAGDGDFLSIGAEHVAPQAARNLDITAVIMDNAVYGLTKGQSSPTTKIGTVTSSTPRGKAEISANPLESYLTFGVSFIGSQVSSNVKPLASMIRQGVDHKGFSIVHVQSPCTTYNNTYEELKGSVKKGIKGTAWDIPESHDPNNYQSAKDLVSEGGIPVGLIFQDESRSSFDEHLSSLSNSDKPSNVQKMIDSYSL